jgi:hypothetical protein
MIIPVELDERAYGLSDSQKQLIRLEETYRAELRKALEEQKSTEPRWAKAINSPFCLFLLSTVLVGLVSWRYNELHDKEQKRLATSSETRKLLYELDYRATILTQELREPSHWVQSTVKKNIYSLHSDSIFVSCTMTCLGSRLLAYSWSVDDSKAEMMRDVRVKAATVEQAILKILPDQNPSPLTAAQADQLRPASTDLSAAVEKTIVAFDGKYVPLKIDPAPLDPSPQANAAPDSISPRGATPLSESAPGETRPSVLDAAPVIGSWRSITNVWKIRIESRDDHFVMFEIENAKGILSSARLAGEFRPTSEQEFIGRHIVGNDTTPDRWGVDGGMRIHMDSPDHMLVQYIDSRYKGGWNFVRDGTEARAN